MVGRMLRSADFQRVLASPPRSRSMHFAAHHVSACPSAPAKPVRKARKSKLSTGDAPSCPPLVDELPAPAFETPPAGCWLGLVVPKRHAKRAVTRNLLKRQMRSVMDSHANALPPGLWVLRLKAPFDKQQFTSPGSDTLNAVARSELDLLLQRAVAPRR